MHPFPLITPTAAVMDEESDDEWQTFLLKTPEWKFTKDPEDSLCIKGKSMWEKQLSSLKPQGDSNPDVAANDAPAPYSYNVKAFPKHFLRFLFVCLFPGKGNHNWEHVCRVKGLWPVSPGSEAVQLSSVSSAPTPHACKTHNEAGRRPPDQRKRSLMLRLKNKGERECPGTSSLRSRPHFRKEEKLKATGKILSPPIKVPPVPLSPPWNI